MESMSDIPRCNWSDGNLRSFTPDVKMVFVNGLPSYALSLIPFKLYLYRTGNRVSEYVSSPDKGALQRADLHQTVDPVLRLYSIRL